MKVLQMGLLNLTEPYPFKTINKNGRAPVLLICDHASKAVPSNLNNLGLDQNSLAKHIGWDIGAAKITHGLSNSLDAVAVLAGFSRLVVDTNRHPGNPNSIPEASDGIIIPGNKGLSEALKTLRMKEYFWPYHQKISDEISRLWSRGKPPVLFSVHTFTPSMNGEDRPWHIGVLWNRDPRIAKPLIINLRKHPDNLIIGDNFPYSGSQFAYSLDVHAGATVLSHCAVEIRQDLANTEERVSYWVNLLSDTMSKIIKRSNIHLVEIH